MVRGAVMLIGGLFSSAVLAEGAPVVFAAPPELRAEISAALKEQGKSPIDLSELETAMYAPEVGAKYQVAAGKMVTLKGSLPKGVREDFAAGQAACRARADQSAERRLACAQHLVDAVWERQLDRVRAELVLEFTVEDSLIGMALYRPGDMTFRAFPWVQPPTPRECVVAALAGPLPAAGMRSMSRELPTATDAATPPALSQGTPQSLTALEVPEGCTLPAEILVEPGVPLAVTISTLWRATAAAHARQAAKPARCTLDLSGQQAVSLRCRGEVASLPLSAATPFGEKAYQAELAKVFVSWQVAAQCEVAPPRKK